YAIIYLYCNVQHRELHSFPTRRSSDLKEKLMRELERDTEEMLERWEHLQERYEKDIYTFKIRDKIVELPLTTTSLSGLKIQKVRSEEHTSELQSRFDLVCRLLLEKKKI